MDSGKIWQTLSLVLVANNTNNMSTDGSGNKNCTDCRVCHHLAITEASCADGYRTV